MSGNRQDSPEPGRIEDRLVAGGGKRVTVVIVLGIVLLIIGFVAKIPVLWTIGIIIALIGVVFAVAGFAGREIAGRRHWY